MRYLSLGDVLDIYRQIIQQSGGSAGIRDVGALESSVAQPRMTFGGADLYPTIAEKASALCFSLIKNHPFIDGNKRVGHAAMETLLLLNGFEINANVEEQEKAILGLAAGEKSREEFTVWVCDHAVEKKSHD